MNNLNEFVFKSFMVKRRKRQEYSALLKLKNKKDYLSRYNLAIRYLFLHYLNGGYDILNDKVHVFFKRFCVEMLKINATEVEKVVCARHQLKYKCIVPSYTNEIILSKIINSLENLNIRICAE